MVLSIFTGERLNFRLVKKVCAKGLNFLSLKWWKYAANQAYFQYYGLFQTPSTTLNVSLVNNTTIHNNMFEIHNTICCLQYTFIYCHKHFFAFFFLHFLPLLFIMHWKGLVSIRHGSSLFTGGFTRLWLSQNVRNLLTQKIISSLKHFKKK